MTGQHKAPLHHRWCPTPGNRRLFPETFSIYWFKFQTNWARTALHPITTIKLYLPLLPSTEWNVPFFKFYLMFCGKMYPFHYNPLSEWVLGRDVSNWAPPHTSSALDSCQILHADTRRGIKERIGGWDCWWCNPEHVTKEEYHRNNI